MDAGAYRNALIALARRKGLHLRPDPATVDRIRTSLLADRFDRQRTWCADRARRKAAKCSRRAGKTDNVPTDLFEGAVAAPGTLQVYCAITRERAKELVWEQFKATAHRLNLDVKPNESELSIRVAAGQGSYVRLTGADKINQAQKRRGDKTYRVRIDEAQLYPFNILKALVDDVFGPTLEDLGGDLGLLGTPGEVCAGYWYNVTRPEKARRAPGWSVHEWTFLDNPHVPAIHQRYHSGELAKDYGGEESPTYLREWKGQWVKDVGKLVYHYDEDRNGHDVALQQLVGEDWLHVLGWDLGADDAMALVAWAFNLRKSGDLFEAFSWKKSGASTDEVMAQVEALVKAGCRFVGRVGDTGGLGKLVVEEVNARHSTSWEAAKKTDKHAHIKLFNEELVAGRVKVARNSQLAQEMAELPKLANWSAEEHQGKPAPEDPRFPNHCCDGALYSWRYAFNWLHEVEAPEPPPGTPEAYELEAQRLRTARTERVQRKPQTEWWEE